jgi:hypothetical protein
MKFVFPTLWISGFGLGTALLWFDAFQGGTPDPPQLKYEFLAAWLAGTAFLLWLCIPLKRVSADTSAIHVSNYRREIVIPFELIERVTSMPWISPPTITVHLRAESEFGRRIKFIPKLDLRIWRAHPAVVELRELAATARKGGTQ